MPGSVELVWLVEGSLLPPRDQDMKGEGLENWVTHLTWWKTKLDSINICHLGSQIILHKRGHLTDDILSDSEEPARSYGKPSDALDGDRVGRS